MYGFLLRPKWIAFHLLVFGGVALMIWLGFWQLQRLDERREFNDTVTERTEEPPVPLLDVLASPSFDPSEAEWRAVTASGTWLADQVLWFNRSQNGRAGDNVLTPLLLEDGTVVIVNRGFVPLGTDVPAPPAVETDVIGRIRPPQVRQRGELTDGTGGPVTEVRRIDLDQLGAQLPGTVAPVYLDLVSSRPEVGPADPTPVPAPTLDDGPHLSYAIQWWIFAACVVIGWVLAIRRSISTRHQQDETVTAEADGRTSPGSPTSGGAASATTPT
jgi:surfeit locus 1 family protein